MYLLGGERAVPKAMENGLDDFTVKRLGGADRYETNRLILQEAGVARKNMMICTGENFADALSASAVGMPILLVKDSLSTGQKDLLRHSGGGIYVLGGEKAVSAALETQLGIYGAVERLAGNTRYDTSARIARRFFPAAQAAVLAGGENFPDALCGGVLACAQGVPLLLIRPGAENTAWEGALSMVCVMGGIRAVPEDAVQSLIQRG